MINQFSRSEILLSTVGMEALKNSHVAIFGIGGVDGYSVEALVRAGVHVFSLFDDDKICLTNLNRQLHATYKTVGQYKVDVAKDRILDINPHATVFTYKMFYGKDNSSEINLSEFDYIIDAIDTVSCKVELILRAKEANTKIVSCMAAGNKLNASAFEVSDIFKTSNCPLSKVMRHELRKVNVEKLKVVYSKEACLTPIDLVKHSCKANCICPPGTERKCTVRRQIPGSVSYVPSVAGLILAGEVINDLVANIN